MSEATVLIEETTTESFRNNNLKTHTGFSHAKAGVFSEIKNNKEKLIIMNLPKVH